MATIIQAADQAHAHWDRIIGGDYTPPMKPPRKVMREVMEHVNHAAGFPEEGRYPRFSVTVAKKGSTMPPVLRFDPPRPCTVGELRRLIPATDANKSTIHIEWSRNKPAEIVGIMDIGTSWHRARAGLGYMPNAPLCMILEVERPNRIHIFQGQVRVASYSDGQIDVATGYDPPGWLEGPLNSGLYALTSRLKRPTHEAEKDFLDFEFIAATNTIHAIANTIAAGGHGGTVLILPPTEKLAGDTFRLKYLVKSSLLTDAFVTFMNARHIAIDRLTLFEEGTEEDEGQLALLRLKMDQAFDELVERIRLVASLAACDGALVITQSLAILGFGCELLANMAPNVEVLEVNHETPLRTSSLNVEDFGMRHRSVIKTVSCIQSAVALVISQDGPISAVWARRSKVLVRKNLRLVNANMPLA